MHRLQFRIIPSAKQASNHDTSALVQNVNQFPRVQLTCGPPISPNTPIDFEPQLTGAVVACLDFRLWTSKVVGCHSCLLRESIEHWLNPNQHFEDQIYFTSLVLSLGSSGECGGMVEVKHPLRRGISACHMSDFQHENHTLQHCLWSQSGYSPSDCPHTHDLS